VAVIATGRLRGTKGAIAPPSLAPTSSRRPSVASRMQENLLAAGAPPLDLCESLERFPRPHGWWREARTPHRSCPLGLAPDPK